MGLKGYPETLHLSYNNKLRYNPKDLEHYLHHGKSLKSHKEGLP